MTTMDKGARFQLVLISVIAIAAAIPTFALAGTVERIPSNVLLFAQEKAKPFRGRVEARRLACRVHRKVKVFRHSNHRLVDKTRTNHRGQWSIPTPNAHGSFFAVVAKQQKESRSGDITYVCRTDQSPVRHFGGS
jgi:hypothetical protein